MSAAKKAPLTVLLSKSSAASLITAPPTHMPVSQPKKAPLTGLLSKSAVPVTYLSSAASRPVSRSKVKAKVQAYKAKVKATQHTLNRSIVTPL